MYDSFFMVNFQMHRLSWHSSLILPSLISLSSLFPDVVNCMQTDNLELKKLVYLYLMNYAKSQPDMAIMAVNTFVKVHRSPINNIYRVTLMFLQ